MSRFSVRSIALLMLLTNSAWAWPFATPRARNILLFVDRSSSTDDAAWTRFQEGIRRFLNLDGGHGGLRDGDSVSLAPIDSTSLTQFSPSSVNIPVASNELRAKQQENAAKAKLKQTFDALQQHHAESTDLFGAFLAAAHHFQSSTQDSVPILIVLSDMLQVGDGVSFERMDLSVPANRSKLLGMYRPPNLKGVHVIIGGASAKSNAQLLGVETFWREYLITAGAVVDAYNPNVVVSLP